MKRLVESTAFLGFIMLAMGVLAIGASADDQRFQSSTNRTPQQAAITCSTSDRDVNMPVSGENQSIAITSPSPLDLQFEPCSAGELDNQRFITELFENPGVSSGDGVADMLHASFGSFDS